MRRVGFPLLLVLLTAFTASASLKDPKTDDKPLDPPLPPGAVHIVAKEGQLDAKLREVFTYFPYPRAPEFRIIPPNSFGVYRVEVTPEGKVATVTILKTLGKRLDTIVLKTYLTWKAKPGPLRVVDISWYYNPGHAGSVRIYHQ